VSWESYKDNITKATVYTLVANGVRWSAATHIDGHGIQVFGERVRPYPGADKEKRYFPVIRHGPYGESEHSTEKGFKSIREAKSWAVATAKELGLIQGEN